MHATDAKFSKPLEPHLRRVLIVDPNAMAARMVAGLMRSLGASELLLEADEARALKTADAINPDLIIVEHAGPRLNGESFTQRLRRSQYACRQVPVIMLTADAFANTIIGARDAGVHEFLRKPFTAAELIRRVEIVTLKPRDWIEAVRYVGPDRRRFNSGEYAGQRKRRSDPDGPSDTKAVELDRSARILRSASTHLDTEPAQARRAIGAQLSLLKKAVDTGASPALATAMAKLEHAIDCDTSKAALAVLVKDVLDHIEAAPSTKAA